MAMTRSSHRALCTCSPSSLSAGGEMVLSEARPARMNGPERQLTGPACPVHGQEHAAVDGRQREPG